MKRVVKFLKILLFLGYFPVMMSFVASEQAEVVCTELKAHVYIDKGQVLITDDGLLRMFRNKFPRLKGVSLAAMNKQEMEELMEKHPVVNRCEIYATPGGVVHVTIKQRKPLLRVFHSKGSYYMDEKGAHIPVFLNHSAHVMVVNGHMNALESDSSLIVLTSYIRNHRFWNAQIEQIYVGEKGDYILVPRVGNHLVVLGGIEDMEIKFRNLKALYQKGWDPLEWNRFRTVNLKYKGQIVCTKTGDR